MTIPAFKAALCSKYPSFNGPDKGELADIEDFLKQYDEKSIGTLWYNFRDDYDKGMIPRRSYFYKLADKLNLLRTSRIEYQKYEQVCFICASKSEEYRYSVEATECPRCGNHERPFYAVCKRGHIVSKEYAQSIIDNFPKGPWKGRFKPNAVKPKGDFFLPSSMI